MEKATVIETIGAIIKEEKLQNLSSQILPNTFVLEESEPFSGYHGKDLPTDPVPLYIYLITKKRDRGEKILRATRSIRQYFQYHFDASPAELCIFNDTYFAIRVRSLESFDIIAELQSCFQGEGIQFMKLKKYNDKGIIKVRKFLDLEIMDEGIYRDLEDPMMYYFEIPVKLSWKVFETITRSVKNNLINNHFDAALGTVYRKDITDVIRIYEKECNLERLKELMNTYMEEIRKFHL
jgi:hypothetical protein